MKKLDKSPSKEKEARGDDQAKRPAKMTNEKLKNEGTKEESKEPVEGTEKHPVDEQVE